MQNNQLIAVIKAILNNEKTVPGVCREDWPDVIAQARRHSVLHLLYYCIPMLSEDQKPDSELCEKIRTAVIYECYKNEKQAHAIAEMQERFEKDGIYSMALKGVYTKNRYPDPVWRSMCDIDILYRPEQTDALSRAMEGLGYGEFQEGRKHDHYSRGGINVEMHRELVASDSEFSGYYEDIWDRCRVRENCKYTYEMSVEDEYIYNFLHLTEHFKTGGIGIRFIMDVYVYEHMTEMDREYVKKELEKLGVLRFYENICRLSDMWFGKFECGDERQLTLLTELGDYIISSGLYGEAVNAAALSVSKQGRIKYLIKVCFPGYREMRSMFPWLARCPVLLPFSWIYRAVRSLRHRRRNIRLHFNMAKNADASRGQMLRQFYKDCGL